MKLNLGEHIGLIGHKGAGKTTAARYIIDPIPRRTIFFCKPDEKSFWGRDGVLYGSAEDLIGKLDILKSSPKKYRRGIIFIDDVLALMDCERGKAPAPLKYLMLTGRSLECTLMMGIHYARRIPPILRNEIDHFLVFRPSVLGQEGIERLFGRRLSFLCDTLKKYQMQYIDNRDGATKTIAPLSVPCGNEKKRNFFEYF